MPRSKQNNIVEFSEHVERPIFVRDRLRDARLEKGWSQTELAGRIHVSVETISNLESGQRQPGAETLSQLCEVLGYEPIYFSKPAESGGKLDSAIFFRSYASKTKRQNLSLDVWRRRAASLFLHVTHYVNPPPVQLPEANWSGTEADENLIEQAEVLAQQCRRLWGLGDGPIGNLTRLAESMGVVIIRLELPDMEEVDGFSCWQDGHPMIFLVAKQSAARERLNLAHELLHLIAHRQIPKDSLVEPAVMKRIERQAFAFAGALSLPRNTYAREIFSVSIPHFIQLKRRWGIAIAAQGKRCLDLGIMDEDRFTQFRKNLSWNRYIKKEPLDDTLPHEKPMLLRQAIELLSQHGVMKECELARESGLPAEKMHQLTGIDAALFSSPVEAAAPLKFQMKEDVKSSLN